MERLRIGVFMDSWYPDINGVIIVMENLMREMKDYADITKQPFYLNKSSSFVDSKTMSIVPIGDNKDIKYYRGLDEDNSVFPSDYINIL